MNPEEETIVLPNGVILHPLPDADLEWIDAGEGGKVIPLPECSKLQYK